MNCNIGMVFPALKCCCCLSLRSGCICIAVFGILCSGLNIDFIISILNRSPSVETNYVFTDELIGAFHLASEFLLMVASIILLVSTMVKLSFVVIIYVVLAVVQTLYLIIFSIVSCSMGINIFVNVNLAAGIAYWMWVTLSCGISPYFIYIAISYYKTKQAQDQGENNV